MQSVHAVGASSSLVQREECHHLVPADTSSPKLHPLQSACVWRDATEDLCRLCCVYFNVYEHKITSASTLLATYETYGSI